MDIVQLLPVFITGLLAGGLSCMAVQGGLLAATIAQRHEQHLTQRISSGGKNADGAALAIVAFLGAKLIAYSALGFLLGWLGSALQFSLTVQIVLQFAVALFMLATALNMLKVHPIFRYVVVQPPRFVSRLIHKESKSKSMFAPIILGAFTVLIPCGTTQAVMALAVASGNPLTGAAFLFAFVLGTSPIFFLFGYFVSKLGEKMQFAFTKFAAGVVIIFALFNFNNALALTGTPYTIDEVGKQAWCFISFCDDDILVASAANDATITIDNAGYSPRSLTVRAGEPVNIHLNNVGGGGCTQAFTIPQLGIQQIVPVGKSQTIAFTAPKDKGQLSFMCSMGMYRGTINVI